MHLPDTRHLSQSISQNCSHEMLMKWLVNRTATKATLVPQNLRFILLHMVGPPADLVGQ